MDLTHAAYRFHAERVIRAVVGRYHDHPAVVGFQVDNEPGLELLHNEGVFQAFVDDLRRTYGDVETLNREWGLVYWSHRLTTWADLWRPDNNAQPQYDLAWRRFQARMVIEFIGWQAAIVREIAGAEKFVTTCIAYDRPGVQDPELTAGLDVTAGNPYYAMQDGLALPAAEQRPLGWTTSGTWAIFHSADRMYSSKQARFLVTETNAGAIGGPGHERARVRRPVATGRLGDDRPGRPDDRVLALAHTALRYRDVLGRNSPARPAPRAGLRTAGRAGCGDQVC
jgi:beta-galactosidase